MFLKSLVNLTPREVRNAASALADVASDNPALADEAETLDFWCGCLTDSIAKEDYPYLADDVQKVIKLYNSLLVKYEA